MTRQQRRAGRKQGEEPPPSQPLLIDGLLLEAARLYQGGRLSEAVACFRRALALQPALPEAHNGMGNALKRIDRLEAAETAFGRALAARPTYAVAYHNLGLVFTEQGRPLDAVMAYQQATRLAPDLAEAHLAQSLALLKLGAWSEGWRRYEFRWFQPTQPAIRLRRFPQPLWAGDPADQRTILLWSEQGFGDTIQFVRFAREMTRHGWKVCLEVQRELVGLLTGLADISVVAMGETLPPFDVHCPLLSLPDRLGTTLDTLPAALCPPVAPEAGQRWRKRLAGAGGLAVGVVWRGSPSHIRDRWRSMEPALFAGFLRQPGVTAVSLQKDARPEELAALGPILDAGPDLGDFADTAALISALDLVISVDTSVLHLAATMGVPCWGLIDFAADWRWLTKRRCSPWYPSVRLFRQSRLGDWGAVIYAVRAELSDLINRRAESSIDARHRENTGKTQTGRD